MLASRGGRPRPRWGTEHRVLAGLAGLLIVVVIANDFGVLTPDTKPEVFLAPWRTFTRFSAWWLDAPFSGAPNFNVGIAPIALVQGLIQCVVPEPWLAMRVWRILLLLAAAWGARRLYGELVHGTSADRGAGRIAIAVAYVANPYLLLGGNTTPTLLPYAFLPWFAWALLRGVRTRSWRWPAAAALALTAMSGVNAGVVPALQLLIVAPVVAHARWIVGAAWVDILWCLLRAALLAAAMSLYWVAATISALTTGSSVAAGTETLATINSTNSFTEVLRGLGFWPLYGSNGRGPFMPHLVAYLDQPIVIVASFGGLILAVAAALLSRSRVRLFAVISLLLGSLVMVAIHPYADPTLAGRGLAWLFDHVPGAIALRTTNKAGALVELAVALLIALGAAEVTARARGTSRVFSAVGVVVLVCAASVLPAVTGGLFQVSMDVPAYWKAAAAALNADDGDSRILMVPGTGVAEYTWGYSGPDEIGSALFDRETEHRIPTPTGNTLSAALLGDLDRRLYMGTAAPGSVSAAARYLGASDVVGRYDRFVDRPVGSVVERALDADPGLEPPSGYGPMGSADGAPHPAEVRAVAAVPDKAPVQLHPGKGAILMDGDGSALSALTHAGLLADFPALVLSGGVDPTQIQQALRDGARVVLTDSNGRRSANGGRPDAAGPLLTATVDPGASTSNFDAASQTVAVVEGVAAVRTSGSGLLFGPFGGGDPTLAFDGDRSTAWMFGNFGTAAGNQVTLRLSGPTRLSQVTVQPTATSSGRIDAVRVTATRSDGRRVSTSARLGEWPTLPTTVTLPAADYSQLSIEVTGARSTSFGPVGIAELVIPGVSVRKVARMPVNLVDALVSAGSGSRSGLAGTPVDVIMERRRGPGDLDEEEPRLERNFTLPDRRTFQVSGEVRLARGIDDAAIDRLAGASGGVVATSSSRDAWRPDARASRALDSTSAGPDLSSGWSPGEPVVGEWWRVGFPARPLDSFTITQDGTSTVTRVWVRVDDRDPFEARLGPGVSTVRLPRSTTAHSVQIVVLERSGNGPVRLTNVSLPRVAAEGRAGDSCLTVASIDGEPLRIRVTDEGRSVLSAGEAVPFTGCDPLDLAPGSHRLRSTAEHAVDFLRLTSGDPPGRADHPDFDVIAYGPGSSVIRLTEDCRPCYLSSGQGFDRRWQAHIGGRSLGVPLTLDGFASGWRVDAGAGSVVTMTYAPGRWAPWSSALSILALAIALVLAVRRPGLEVVRMRRGRPRTLPWTPSLSSAVVGGVAGTVAALVTAGPWPALLVAVVAAAVPVRRRFLLAAVPLVVVAVAATAFAAGLDGAPAERIARNTIGNAAAGAVVWLLIIGVIHDLLPRHEEELPREL